MLIDKKLKKIDSIMAKQFKPETLCVQAGWSPKKGEPRVLPIYQSTTFKYETSEQMARLFDLEESGYFYTRLQNPTNDAVAAKIAALEGGVAAMLTSSGQAANYYAIFNICEAGDHFVCSSAIYGGTFNLFGVTMKKQGIDVTFVNPDASEEEISAAFRPNTKALFGETISNPALEVLDIEKFARIAHKHGVPLIVDNTFPTPINCRPFEWGADIVVHSTTKYMDGHATSVGGCIVDSGNFDWDAHADKFPGLCTPDESYHGLTYTKAFGKMAYIVKCTSVDKNPDGSIAAIHCTADLETGNGNPADGRKVKGTIHWVSAAHCIDAEVRLYDKLFTEANMNAIPEGSDYKDYLNPESVVACTGCKLEESLKDAKPGDKFQFVRTGFFTPDSKNPGVYNRVVTLRDSFKPAK